MSLLAAFAKCRCAAMTSVHDVSVPAGASPAQHVTCDVCMCEVPFVDCSSNGCGHIFCNGCWRSHLAVQIQDGKARHVICMAYKCGVVCDEELVLRVMKVRLSVVALPSRSWPAVGACNHWFEWQSVNAAMLQAQGLY